MGGGIGGDTDFQLFDLGRDARNELIGGILAHRHRHRQGHTAFPGRAKGGAQKVAHHLIHISVRHNNAVVLGPGHGLYPFAVGRAGLIDIVGDIRRANKADGAHIGVRKQCIHRFLIAIDHIQHPGRSASLKK